MISTTYTERVRTETINWLNDNRFDYFITLTFHNEVNDSKAKKECERVLTTMDRFVFGKRSKRRLYKVVAFETHALGGTHIHLLVESPSRAKPHIDPEDWKEKLRYTWERQRRLGRIRVQDPTDQKWFQPIDDTEHVLRYVTKQYGFDPDVIDYDLSYLPNDITTNHDPVSPQGVKPDSPAPDSKVGLH